MATDRITETIEGIVSQVNERGFKLAERGDWLNVSKWASPAPTMPYKDERVKVGIDKAGFVRSIVIVEDSKGFPAGQRWQDQSSGAPQCTPAAPESTPAPASLQARVAALQAATRIVGRPTSVADLLSTAEALERWLCH